MNTELGKSSDNVISCSKPTSVHSVNHVDRGVSILYYNARSLLPKLDVVYEATKPDIVCIVETWLDDRVSDSELSLDNYQLFRFDRNRHGGGVAIYVCNFLSCNIIVQGGPHRLEFISLSISSPSFVNKFCICLFYRPPSSPVSIFDNLCTTLQLVNPAQFSRFLLIGDFNVNFYNKEHCLFSYLCDILYSFSLTQVVPSYTHMTPSGTPTLIDIAMLSDIDHLKSCTTVPSLSTSDHLGVLLTLTLKSYAVSVVKSRSVWLYKDADFNRACELIEETDWDSLLSEDVDESTVRWTERYLAIMEQCIPRHSVRRKHNLPWLTTNIVRHIRKRNTIISKSKKE